MDIKTFKAKAESMGDFYVYYKEEDNTRFSVCTTDFSTPYVAKRVRNKKTRKGEVLMWNWTSNRILRLPVSAVTRMTPLSAVLKNVE